MATQPYVPSMSDAAVKVRTGRDWAGWFSTLDAAGASGLKHSDIAKILADGHGMPGWWSQMVTVQYELARGLRVRHQTAKGFSASVSKTLPVSLSKLYAAVAQPAQRRKWFPKGAFELSSKTQNKYFRGAWRKQARLEMGFYSKGAGKSQIAVQINQLARQKDVASERAAWKAAFARLQTFLEA